MNSNSQKGFSLVELMLVVVILGVLSTVAVPYLVKAVHRAEESNAFATMRTISSAEVNYLSERGRFARLPELNTAQANSLGTTSGNDLLRGKFTFQMPGAPSDDDLRKTYTIIGSKPGSANESAYIISLDQSGEIRRVFP